MARTVTWSDLVKLPLRTSSSSDLCCLLLAVNVGRIWDCMHSPYKSYSQYNTIRGCYCFSLVLQVAWTTFKWKNKIAAALPPKLIFRLCVHWLFVGLSITSDLLWVKIERIPWSHLSHVAWTLREIPKVFSQTPPPPPLIVSRRV